MIFISHPWLNIATYRLVKAGRFVPALFVIAGALVISNAG